MKGHIIEDYTGWTLDYDNTLICPCGRRVEDDGTCPDGHESPLKQEGMI